MEEKFSKILLQKEGSFITFRQDEVIMSNGKKAIRDTVQHPGAVAVLACTSLEEILLVKQYRYPIGRITWEIPAGKLERGEDPVRCAQRELAEETGFTAANWQKLISFYTAPGFSNEIIHLYLATDLQEKQASPDPDEIIEYVKLPLAQVYQKVKNGEIIDAKTIIGVLWLVKLKGLQL
ncbi:MAG: hydrolase [Peptococcaceae bacterium]|nr:hydrolase [Peptococcaceae bacterium]